MVNNAWRCLVLILLGLILAVGLLTYRPEPKSEPVALWSHKWMGPHWDPRRTQLVRSALWRMR